MKKDQEAAKAAPVWSGWDDNSDWKPPESALTAKLELGDYEM